MGRNRIATATLAAALVAAAAAPAVAQDAAPSAVAQDSQRALAIAREVERIAAGQPLWPGFDPLSVPLTIYTGSHTYLFRHPSPPEGFVPLADAQPDVSVFDGRHPSMVANTSVELGGVMTATLLVAGGPRGSLGPRELAAVALHEAFHAFQRARHPGWAGNEADMLLYPVDDAGLLALRRRESAALHRALAAADAADDAAAACWARLALDARRERFAAMAPPFSAYERLTELNEGLAMHLQLRVEGRTTVEVPEAGFPPAAVRNRIYSVGPAFAFLLDRFHPDWQAALEDDDAQSLDALLRAALDARTGDTGSCGFGAGEVAEIERSAEEDVAALVARQAERRKAFDARDGWRVVVEAARGRPLWPQGFDPINVEHVEGGLLHTRFLRLGNDSGELQAVDVAGADVDALTEAAGANPLFNGVARLTVAGLAGRPEVEGDDARITLRAPGFTASFRDADVEERGRVLVIRLR